MPCRGESHILIAVARNAHEMVGCPSNEVRISMTDGFEIKRATPEDADLIVSFIKELAVEEKFPGTVAATKQDIEKALFSAKPAAEAIIGWMGSEPVSFAVYYHSFSTTRGMSGLHLDDLYIVPKARKSGVGKMMMDHLLEIARANGYERFEWWCLKWNSNAIRFFERLGARALDDHKIFRLDVTKASAPGGQ